MKIETDLKNATETFGLTEHSDRIEDRARDESYGLLVMVIGAGNFGKSSLINALCAKSVAPVAITPKSFKIDIFRSGPTETAYVRRVGEQRATEHHPDRAREIEAAAEANFRMDGTADLAEIVWTFPGVSLPPGISLVDTPGISQAIGGAAKGRTLVKVIGTSFEVDEVWAHWFHRADVAVWAFSANKMKDKDTRLALEAALALFDKPIIPVATKADLIPQDRWPELHQEFQDVYGPLLQGRQVTPLHLTVCGGQKPDLMDHGIPELRANFHGLARDSADMKRRAHAAFLHDEAKAVTAILDTTAQSVVSNLRSIASLGDSLASEAEKEADRALEVARDRVESYLRELRNGGRVSNAASEVHRRTRGGRDGDVEGIARNLLEAMVDDAQIDAMINESFASGARSLEAVAERFSQSADLTTLTFKSSGKVFRHPIPLQLELRATKSTSKLSFRIRLRYPKGFFGKLWDFIGDILGFDRFSVEDIRSAMASALSVSSSDLVPAKKSALHEGFAPAIRDAIEKAIMEHLKSVDSDALARLRDVDSFLPRLDAEGAKPRITTFGSQAEYWATLRPEVETLLNLARAELKALMPEFESLLARPFPFEHPSHFARFKTHWRNRVVSGRLVTTDISLRRILKTAEFIEGYVEPYSSPPRNRTRIAPFLPHLLEAHHKFLEKDPIIAGIDSRLENCVVGARYKSAGARVALIGSQAFKEACENTPRKWRLETKREGLWKFTFAPATLAGTATLLLLGISLIWFSRIAGAMVLALAATWFVIGVYFPFVSTAVAYRMGIRLELLKEIKACQMDTNDHLPKDVVDEVVRGMTAELAPRPLQKLLLDAGLLGTHPQRK